MPRKCASTGRLCNTCLPHGSTVFGDLVPLARDLIRSGRQGVGGRRRRARQLAAVPHLRAVRSADSYLDGRVLVRVRDPSQAPHASTRVPVESGGTAGPPRRQRFTISFYLTAMLFIVFDIEIVFLYPLGVVLHQLAWFGFLEFLFFLVILVVAYVYVWRKGALEWQ